MRNLLRHNITSLLPLLFALPVALSATPVCDACTELRPAKNESSAHACCEKKTQVKKAHQPDTCAACLQAAAPVTVADELKVDFHFVAAILPGVQGYPFSRQSPAHANERNLFVFIPPDRAFITQHKILV